MKKKRETIQIRVDTELKEKLVHQAEQSGISPSELIRRLIKMAVNDGTRILTQLEEGEQDLRVAVTDILKCIQMMSRKQTWSAARSVVNGSMLPEILDQMLYFQWGKVDRLDQYYKEREELFGTQSKKPAQRER